MQVPFNVPNAVGSVTGSSVGGGTSSGNQQVVKPASDLGKSQGQKFDGGKAPLAQGGIAYFGKALEGVAVISAYGAAKYSVPYADQNWRRVENGIGRYSDAAARHFAAHLRGEHTDPESGKPHIDMAAWNILAVSELIKDTNDLF